MKHVRLTMDAGGREAEVHPVYDLLANAPFVERATAIQWTVSDDEIAMMHRVEGDRDRFEDAVAPLPEVLAYELAPDGGGAFYAYVVGAATEPIRRLFETVAGSPVVVLPPLEYRPDGSVSYSVFGPGEAIQAAIEAVPDPVDVSVDEVSGLAGTPAVARSLLSDRQRDAVEAALDVGYYEVPREGGQADVAAAMGCAPSTAAEHLRKAEATVLRAAFRRS